MNPENDLSRLVRALKGAPAALFLALVLHGGPQTVKTLCRYTGYSEKVVRQGLVRLMEIGLTFYDSDLRAWYLVEQTALLRQLQQGLLSTPAQARGSNPARGELSTELSTGRTAREDPTAMLVDSTAGGEEFTGRGHVDGHETAVAADPVEENSTVVLVDSTAGGEEFSARGHAGGHETAVAADPVEEDSTVMLVDSTAALGNSAAMLEVSTPDAEEIAGLPGYITTTTKPDHEDKKVVSKQVRAANMRGANMRATNKRLSPAVGGSREKILVDWLVRGGIGRKTPKMLELLASDLDLEIVKAHVLERMAWEAGLLPDGPTYLTGLLIHKLLGGDPPPPMRCEECLSLPDKHGLCACDYESLVHR